MLDSGDVAGLIRCLRFNADSMELAEVARLIEGAAALSGFGDMREAAAAMAREQAPQQLYDFGFACIERAVAFLAIPALRRALEMMPAAVGSNPGDITRLDRAGAETALRGVLPAVGFASLLIPELIERGAGGLLFVGALSSVVPMPPHGGFALWSAALRNYAITLHAALAPAGIYAGTIAIGGLIERSDIHKSMLNSPDLSAGVTAGTLDPDELAETVWQLYTKRDRPEAVVSVFGT